MNSIDKNPSISVVIPVGNGSAMLGDVLHHIAACDPLPYEVIIVNDHVRDGTLFCVSEYENAPFSLLVVPNRENIRGPASARNTGAEAASGDIVLFVDSDVMLPPAFFARLCDDFTGAGITAELKRRVRDALQDNGNQPGENLDLGKFVPDAAGVLGIQSDDMIYRNAASVYKNHWMRFTYLRPEGPVHLFYTSGAAIFRDAFLKTSRFDAGYITPSVEDTAYGRELAESGVIVYIDRELEYEHRKKYDSRGVLKTDYKRAAELARLILREGRGNNKNQSSVPTGFILSMPLAAILPLWVIPVALFPDHWIFAAGGFIAHLILFYFLNVEWLGYISARAKPILLYSLVFLPLEAAVGFWGGIWGVISYLFGKKY